MTTLHILSSPHNPVHINNRIDPFSIATLKFIKYMTYYGWNCIHYGAIGSEVSCENVICTEYSSPDYAVNIKNYNEKAGKEIALRKKPGDIIACFYGLDNKDAALKNNDLKIVEPSIGYTVNAIFAEYRVFVSYAHMHMFYGLRDMTMTPSWFDAVIPNAVTPEEFTFNDKKQDYFLYFGRVIESKGIHTAIQATEKAGKKLIIAGPGSLKDLGYRTIPKHVTCVGLCNADQRRELMSNAKAIFGATNYVEPFGNMVVEGYMSGTPAITTDWGAFPETVVNGVTGFRCREMSEFVRAVNKIDEIDPNNCKNWAMKNYSDPVVHMQFDHYFRKIIASNFYR